MNIFLRELSAYRKSTLIWMAVMSAMGFVFMAGMWPGFSSDITAAKDLLSNLPPAVKAAFSISLENFFTVFGFYAYLLTFATVAMGIQAMNVGTGVISKEFSGKTADFLLSKPVKRWQVLSAKLAAALVSVVLVGVTFGVVTYVAALIGTEESFSAATFFLLSATVLLVQIFFLALGMLFAVLIPKIKSVVTVSLPAVFAFFIIGTLGEIVGNEEVRYITPFKFFDPLYIMNNQSLETKFLLLEVAAVAVLVAVAYTTFQKKNLRASA